MSKMAGKKMRMPRNSWPTHFGFKTFVNDCVESKRYSCRIFSLADWKKCVSSQKSQVPIVCCICEYETSVQIDNFHTRLSAKCFCTGAVRWSSREGHARLLQLISKTKYEPLPEMLSFDTWSKKSVDNHSYLPIRCMDCGVNADKCEINAFVQTRGARCACLNQTETMVYKFISRLCVDLYGDQVEVKREESISRLKKPLKFDIAIYTGSKLVLFVEVDGAQHFRRSTGFGVYSEGLFERDVKKEIDAIEFGVSVLRVFQEDVWHNRFAWKSFIRRFVQRAVEGVLPLKVYRQHHMYYQSGDYLALRKGTKVEVDLI